jgi:hypothetical protein
MKIYLLQILLAMAFVGCSSSPGHGLWPVQVGGEARLKSADGGEVVVESLSTSSPAPGSMRRERTAKPQSLSLAAGTRVKILAIDGDDARVEIEEGSHAGTIHWVECAHLEPVSP